jgi:hypothetical protein
VEASNNTNKELTRLPEPNMNSGGVGTENDEKKNGNNTLMAGQYDEGESHN